PIDTLFIFPRLGMDIMALTEKRAHFALILLQQIAIKKWASGPPSKYDSHVGTCIAALGR
ncbi:MAG: hypothetical protein VW893_04065, partial [Alphaproteobacteria bacterium]